MPAMQETQEMKGQSLGQEDPLQKDMATHCSVLAMDKGAWQATVHRVAKSWTWLKQLSTTFIVKKKRIHLPVQETWAWYWRRKWRPSPVFLPGEFHEQRGLLGYSPWGPKELAMTEATNSFPLLWGLHYLHFVLINFYPILNASATMSLLNI